MVEECGRIGHLQVDHRNDWCKNRETVLANLDRLCSYHHGLKTRFGWRLVEGEGPRAMVPP
jgi:hypothetical protein